MLTSLLFDWGGTIYDNATASPFPDSKQVLEHFSKKYSIAIVSFADDTAEMNRRFDILERFDLRKYLQFAIFHPDKNNMYHLAMRNLNSKPENTLVIDDYMQRIAYLKTIGCRTAWVRRGKFADQTPTEKTGQPDHIINSLSDLIGLI
ncbi:MAG: HAD hydrolase-like protein [Candidatus Gracilibacteria bacterium]